MEGISLEDFIQVVNVKHQQDNWFIGRPSPLQNTNVMKDERDRYWAVQTHWDDLELAIKNDDPVIMCELYSLMDYIRETKIVIKLGCYCAPKACHGDNVKKQLIRLMQSYPSILHFGFARDKGYEVSTIGDKRFSALVATMPDGRTIESHYQCDVKGYEPGGTNWKLGKGKPSLKHQTPEMLYCEYIRLWREWSYLHLDLMEELRIKAKENDNILRDTFAKTNVAQSRALAQLLSERFPQG